MSKLRAIYAVGAVLLTISPVYAGSIRQRRWCSFFSPTQFIRGQWVTVTLTRTSLDILWPDGVRTPLRRTTDGWLLQDNTGAKWIGSVVADQLMDRRPPIPDEGFELTRKGDGSQIDCNGWPTSDI